MSVDEGLVLWISQPETLEVDVELNEEGLGEWVLGFHCVHGSQQEAQRVARGIVLRPALEVLHKDTRSDVETEGDKGVHL